MISHVIEIKENKKLECLFHTLPSRNTKTHSVISQLNHKCFISQQHITSFAIYCNVELHNRILHHLRCNNTLAQLQNKFKNQVISQSKAVRNDSPQAETQAFCTIATNPDQSNHDHMLSQPPLITDRQWWPFNLEHLNRPTALFSHQDVHNRCTYT